MAGIVTLEDGSFVYASNMGLGGALERVATAIGEDHPQLARWLSDMAQRGGGFTDFDIRGLSPEHRAAFWLGIKRANEASANWDQEKSYSPSVGVLRLFSQRRGFLPDSEIEQVPAIDLDDLWFNEGGP